MRNVILAAVILSFIFLRASNIYACTCSAQTPRHAFRDAAAVFIGQVIENVSNRDVEARKEGYVSEIRFKVEKSWKGAKSEIVVWSDYFVGQYVGFNFADSTWKCNRTLFEKYFVWGPVTKRLARPII